MLTYITSFGKAYQKLHMDLRQFSGCFLVASEWKSFFLVSSVISVDIVVKVFLLRHGNCSQAEKIVKPCEFKLNNNRAPFPAHKS